MKNIVKRAIRGAIGEAVQRRRRGAEPLPPVMPVPVAPGPTPSVPHAKEISEKEWWDFLMNNPPFFH